MADLKWKIDIQAPQGEVKKADAAVKGLEGHLKGTGEAAHKAMGPLQRMGRSLLMQAEGFHSIGLAAGEARAKTGEFLEFIGAEAALEMLKSIAEKMIEIGEEAVKSAAKAERINRVINVATGSREMGEASRKWLENFSKASEFSEAANEKAFIGLKKAGVDQQHAGLFMKASADIAAVSENKDEAYQGAIEAFERIQQTGRVSSRMLRPLGIGVEDFKKLDRFKGMSSKAVNDALAKETNVNQGELFQLIMSRAGEKKIGTRSADNMDLLSTKMEKLQELPERFFKRLGDTKAVGQLAHALDGVLTKLDPDSPAGQKIFGALEKAFSTIAGVVDSIDFDEVANVLKDDVIPAFSSMIGMVKPFLEFVEREIRGLQVLHDALVGPTPKSKAVDEFKSNYHRGGEDEDSPSFLKPLAEQPSRSLSRRNEDIAGMGPSSTSAAGFDDFEAAGTATDKHRTRAGVVMGATHHTRHTTIHVNVSPATVHVAGGKDGEENGKKAANAYTKELRKGITSIVEQANASGGM